MRRQQGEKLELGNEKEAALVQHPFASLGPFAVALRLVAIRRTMPLLFAFYLIFFLLRDLASPWLKPV